MFSWFQKLLPKQGNFFELFEAHAATLTAGAEALSEMLRGGAGMQAAIQTIVDEEHKADDIIRDVLVTVRSTFLTPFDRGAIIGLISKMDDTIDQMNQTATTINTYDVTTFEPQMHEVAVMAGEAARIIKEAVGLLREVGRNAGRLHDLTERIVKLEGQADMVHDDGIKALHRAAVNGGDMMRFIVGREIYSHLERIMDRFEDVANEIQGLVIDHA